MGTLHLNPEELVERIHGVITDLHELTNEYDNAMLNEAKLNAQYKLEIAKLYLQAEGPVEERKMKAQEETAALHLQYVTAEATMKAIKERIQVLRDELVGYECILSAMKTEMNLTGAVKRHAS